MTTNLDALERAARAMKAIAEGYVTTARDDRYIIVANPDYKFDDGSDPNLVVDTALFERLRSELEAERERRRGAEEALRPFAAMAHELEHEPAWAGVLEHDHPLAGRVSVADFRAARAHFQSQEASNGA